MNIFFILNYFLLFFKITAFIQMKKIHTNLFRGIPFLKFHDAILCKNISKNEIILIDFVPIKNSSMIHILLGKSIYGNLRFFLINNLLFNYYDMAIYFIIENIPMIPLLSNDDIDNLKSIELRELIVTLKDKYKDTKYNLYQFNCKHFCNHVLYS
jgi:hypothetical protein